MNLRTFYFLDANAEPQGPYTPRQINDFRNTGVLHWSSLIAEPGADEWCEMSAYADVIAPDQNAPAPSLTADQIAAAISKAQGGALAGAGKKTVLAGLAVGLVNPIGGAAMIAAGIGMSNAGHKLKGQ